MKSIDFPGCCSPIIYLLRYQGDPGSGYLRMTFDDLDIPPDSTLKVSFVTLGRFTVNVIEIGEYYISLLDHLGNNIN